VADGLAWAKIPGLGENDAISMLVVAMFGLEELSP